MISVLPSPYVNPLEDDPLEDDPLEDDPLEDDPLDDEPLEDDPLEDDPLEEESVDDDPLSLFVFSSVESSLVSLSGSLLQLAHVVAGHVGHTGGTTCDFNT